MLDKIKKCPQQTKSLIIHKYGTTPQNTHSATFFWWNCLGTDNKLGEDVVAECVKIQSFFISFIILFFYHFSLYFLSNKTYVDSRTGFYSQFHPWSPLEASLELNWIGSYTLWTLTQPMTQHTSEPLQHSITQDHYRTQVNRLHHNLLTGAQLTQLVRSCVQLMCAA
jgi:hypothetical protein